MDRPEKSKHGRGALIFASVTLGLWMLLASSMLMGPPMSAPSGPFLIGLMLLPASLIASLAALVRHHAKKTTVSALVFSLVSIGLFWVGANCGGKSRVELAKEEYTKARLGDLAAALEGFRRDVGRYPSSAEGLGALFRAPADLAGWRGPYFDPRDEETCLEDGWGHRLDYEVREGDAGFKLTSPGADGEINTIDDIHR